MKYFITKHCKERFIQRVNNGLNKDDNLLRTIFKNLNTGKDITNQVFDKTPRFILYLYERYKRASIKLILQNGYIYILSKRKGTDNLFDVLTVYHSHKHLEQFENSILTREEIFIKIKQIKKEIR